MNWTFDSSMICTDNILCVHVVYCEIASNKESFIIIIIIIIIINKPKTYLSESGHILL